MQLAKMSNFRYNLLYFIQKLVWLYEAILFTKVELLTFHRLKLILLQISITLADDCATPLTRGVKFLSALERPAFGEFSAVKTNTVR